MGATGGNGWRLGGGRAEVMGARLQVDRRGLEAAMMGEERGREDVDVDTSRVVQEVDGVVI